MLNYLGKGWIVYWLVECWKNPNDIVILQVLQELGFILSYLYLESFGIKSSHDTICEE